MLIVNGRIEEITSGTKAEAQDERHEIGVPGLPNLHSHAFQRAMAGLTERRGPTEDSFWTWREAMYRFVDCMDADDIEAIAAQAFLEMLESGFTRVGEFHYVHHDPAGAAYGDIAELADLPVVIDSHHYGRVEDAHMAICHMVCYAFMEMPNIAQDPAI